MTIGFIILLLVIIGFIVPTLKSDKKRGMANPKIERPEFDSLPIWEFNNSETPVFIFYIYKSTCGFCKKFNILFDIMIEKYKELGLGHVKLNYDTTQQSVLPIIKESIRTVPSVIIVGMSGQKYRLENPLVDIEKF